MTRVQFYEPMIQEEQKPMQIRGFPVTIGGTYVLLDDVVTVLREFAQSLADPDQAALVHEVATWLVSGEQGHVMEQKLQTIEEKMDEIEYSIYGAEVDDVTPDVDRVELFPSEERGMKKWYARSLDTSGNVMKVTNGSFDKPFVEKNARERWPGFTIYEVQDENERSMFKERGKRGYAHELWAGHHA